MMRHLLAVCAPALLAAVLLLGGAAPVLAQAQEIEVLQGPDGYRLLVDGEPTVINGMNWDYFPVGTNYTYSLWRQPDDIVRAALAEEMLLLRNMNVNAVRMYTGVPARWIEHIYEEYGIYTLLNHSFGRYGLTVNGAWRPNTDYADAATQELLYRETRALVEEYGDTPGLLMFLLGNENNYGLFWDGAETEDIPVEDRRSTKRARAMYRAMNAAARRMKDAGARHPVAICNGDLLFLDLIAEECPDVDVLGTNMYRGRSFRDAFARVAAEYGKPLMFTEFGADAFDAVANKEHQRAQAEYLVANWREIYANAAGMGGAGNSLGGFTFQFSDGWWKFGQTDNLDVHDNNASWANGGYAFDFVEGDNNMNEEWFGVCAKGPTDVRGLYELYPRASYYALKRAHTFEPYAAGADSNRLAALFGDINLAEAVLEARSDQAALDIAREGRVGLSRLTGQLTTFSTGGSLVSTPEQRDDTRAVYPDQQGFDHMQSFFVGVRADPSPNLRANVELNVLGNVARNPINEIFYENRGRPIRADTDQGPLSVSDNNRVAVYRASVDWTDENFDLTGFYRTGHYHWGYEGDFFGLYPEANYGPNIDIYNGNAPLGAELEGKRKLSGLTVAMGPELWWGANPAVLAKYTRDVGKVRVTGIFQEDLDNRNSTESSFAIPMPKTRKATLQAKATLGRLGLEVGGIWAGQPLKGRPFQLARTDAEGNTEVYEDRINGDDLWGAKAKVTYAAGPVNWYAQGAAQGLVANGGADYTTTYTGWRLRGSSVGNQYNFLTGFTYLLGDLQIAPNFMWQRPIEGPVPADAAAPARPRNILDDPFAVRENRETVAGEILVTFDPTPATWMYAWDSDEAEDARLAFAAGFVYRHHPTTLDAAIGILPNGRTTFAFPSAVPAADLWEAHARIISKATEGVNVIANLYGGTAQANGSDAREISRGGGDVRVVYKTFKAVLGYKKDDWGPYDYHRDFNLTFPHQAWLDISKSLGRPTWFALPTTKIGLMGTYRTLNRFSPRYCPTRGLVAGELVCDPTAPGFRDGNEWEIRTYLHVNIFQ